MRKKILKFILSKLVGRGFKVISTKLEDDIIDIKIKIL